MMWLLEVHLLLLLSTLYDWYTIRYMFHCNIPVGGATDVDGNAVVYAVVVTFKGAVVVVVVVVDEVVDVASVVIVVVVVVVVGMVVVSVVIVVVEVVVEVVVIVLVVVIVDVVVVVVVLAVIVVVGIASNQLIYIYNISQPTQLTIHPHPSTCTRAIIIILWSHRMRDTRSSILTRLQFVITYCIPIDLTYRRRWGPVFVATALE